MFSVDSESGATNCNQAESTVGRALEAFQTELSVDFENIPVQFLLQNM